MRCDVTAAPDQTGDLALFLKSLAEEGRAPVSPGPLGLEHPGAAAALQQLDSIARTEFALELPPFSPAAGLWAAQLVYSLCQFTVCRDIDEARINEVCAVACPETRSPAVDWSVDLTLRHLPKIFQLARRLSHADPLGQQMQQIAVTWPLSSVGVPGLADLRLESFIDHRALRRLYGDRILAAGDASRLSDPRVTDLLRADLGAHHELAPDLARKLFPHAHDTH